MEREVLVYIDLEGITYFVGRLWSRIRKNREGATFIYDESWLKNPLRFALEPALLLGPGPHHTGEGKAIFGALGDSAPDRWGRILMRRFERLRTKKEKSIPRTLYEIDYLLLVDDGTRQGALRFKETAQGPFLANYVINRVPPLLELPKLLGASYHVLNEEDTDADLRFLLAPGSSLGGARPKASVRDRDGQLAIAKFPCRQDEINIVAWEAVAFSLAKKAGIITPEWRLENVANRQVLLIKRFDRRGVVRLPFLSAMSMLSAEEHETRSYLEIVDALRQHGASVSTDLAELWRRIVFSILISNTDDHLRNHGFLYIGDAGWRLSPVYDLNPVPVDIKPRVLSTAIDMDDPTASLDIAFKVSESFGLKRDVARKITHEVASATSTWKTVATSFGISKLEIERVSSAFEHIDSEKGRLLR